MRVAVVGLGIMGAATLARLAERGVRAIGIEREDRVAHDRGSSHGGTRVTRKAYYEDPRYVPMLLDAYEGFRRLSSRAGEALLVETGGLNLGPADHPAIQGVLESCRQHALPHEVLDAREVMRRFPVLRPRQDDIAVYEDAAGVLLAERSVRAYLASATEDGAQLRLGAAVRAIDQGASSLRVHVGDVSVECDRVVLCAGPWLASPTPLVRAPVPLVVSRETHTFFRDDLSLPVFIHFLADRAFYGVPGVRGEAPKISRHHRGVHVGDVATLDRTFDPAEAKDVEAHVAAHVPSAGPIVRGSVCTYTTTPDAHFAIGPHPDDPRIVWAGGFSGHGFKLAPVVAEIAVAMALGERVREEAALFRLDRFAPRGGASD